MPITVTIVLAIAALICGIAGAAKNSTLYTAVGVIVLAVAVLVAAIPK